MPPGMPLTAENTVDRNLSGMNSKRQIALAVQDAARLGIAGPVGRMVTREAAEGDAEATGHREEDRFRW